MVRRPSYKRSNRLKHWSSNNLLSHSQIENKLILGIYFKRLRCVVNSRTSINTINNSLFIHLKRHMSEEGMPAKYSAHTIETFSGKLILNWDETRRIRSKIINSSGQLMFS